MLLPEIHLSLPQRQARSSASTNAAVLKTKGYRELDLIDQMRVRLGERCELHQFRQRQSAGTQHCRQWTVLGHAQTQITRRSQLLLSADPQLGAAQLGVALSTVGQVPTKQYAAA